MELKRDLRETKAKLDEREKAGIQMAANSRLVPNFDPGTNKGDHVATGRTPSFGLAMDTKSHSTH